MARKSRIRKRLTRQQVRDLDIEIQFLEGLILRDPDYVDALRILSDDYIARGHYDLGLMVDEQLAELVHDDPSLFFNLACSYSLNDQQDAAADALTLAIDYGFNDWKWLAREGGLEKLRSNPKYQHVLAKIQAIMTPTPS